MQIKNTLKCTIFLRGTRIHWLLTDSVDWRCIISLKLVSRWVFSFCSVLISEWTSIKEAPLHRSVNQNNRKRYKTIDMMTVVVFLSHTHTYTHNNNNTENLIWLLIFSSTLKFCTQANSEINPDSKFSWKAWRRSLDEKKNQEVMLI